MPRMKTLLLNAPVRLTLAAGVGWPTTSAVPANRFRSGNTVNFTAKPSRMNR